MNLKRRNIWCDVVLVPFGCNINYDYSIPHALGDRVTIVARELVKRRLIPEDLGKKLLRISTAEQLSCPVLQTYLSDTSKFGCEVFPGFGALYRWREGEFVKAVVRVCYLVSPKHNKFVRIVQDAVRISPTDGTYESFQTHMLDFSHLGSLRPPDQEV